MGRKEDEERKRAKQREAKQKNRAEKKALASQQSASTDECPDSPQPKPSLPIGRGRGSIRGRGRGRAVSLTPDRTHLSTSTPSKRGRPLQRGAVAEIGDFAVPAPLPSHDRGKGIQGRRSTRSLSPTTDRSRRSSKSSDDGSYVDTDQQDASMSSPDPWLATQQKPNYAPTMAPCKDDPIILPYNVNGNNFVLFDNSITVNPEKVLLNMCLHNVVAHGLIFLIKVDPEVRQIVAAIPPGSCRYFSVLRDAVKQTNAAKRNVDWGEFIFTSLNLENRGRNDMSGDAAALIEQTLQGHISFEVGPSTYNVLQVWPSEPKEIKNFPKLFVDTMREGDKKSKITFKDLLFVAPPNHETSMHRIQQEFHYDGHNYRLKFVVNYIGDKTRIDTIGHYVTYVHDERSNDWWLLDDLSKTEKIEPNINAITLNVSLMVFARTGVCVALPQQSHMAAAHDEPVFHTPKSVQRERKQGKPLPTQSLRRSIRLSNSSDDGKSFTSDIESSPSVISDDSNNSQSSQRSGTASTPKEKKEKAKMYMREWRSKQSEEKKKENREKDQQRKEISRNVSEKVTEIRVKTRQRESRAALSPAKAIEIREKNAERHWIDRLNLHPAVAASIRKQDAIQKRIQRESRTPQEADAQRETHRIQEAARVEALDKEQKDEMRQIKADQQRLRYAKVNDKKIAELAQSLRAFNRDGQSQLVGENDPPFYNESVVELHYLGPLNVLCEYCTGTFFKYERPSDGKFTICCQKGKLQLPLPEAYDPELKDIMTNPQNSLHQHFHEHIRSINASCSFISHGVKVVQPPGFGDYTFMVNGHPCHVMDTLIPEEDQTARFAQIHIMDSLNEQNDLRMKHAANVNIQRGLLEMVLEAMRKAENYYLNAFRNIGQLLDVAKAENQDMSKISVIFNDEYKQPDVHEGRQNAPTTDEELAYVYVDENSGEPPSFHRSFRVYAVADKDKKRQYDNTYINIHSPHLQPMTYPLLYLDGRIGWNTNWTCDPYPGVENNKINKRFSMSKYYAALMQIRSDEFWRPHVHAGRLFQQWIVDAALSVESNNLDWVRFHQDELFNAKYAGLINHTMKLTEKQNESKPENEKLVAGLPIVLPSSFEGSPRNMRQQCLDAMAIFRDFGDPDVFITFTANPKWREIVENLRPGEKISDRPDLMNKTFKGKVEDFMFLVTQLNFFGKVTAHVHTVEFQKRGKPHVHILISLDEEDKFRTKERIDQFFSAEIPDPEKNPELFALITTSMMHGPCRVGLCKEKDKSEKCKKFYPKPVNPETYIDKKGITQYRRRSTGIFTGANGRKIHNGFVVCNCPYLTKRYNAHINCEVVSAGGKHKKYLYKYIYKGFDVASCKIMQDGVCRIDEVSNFISCRYMGSCEAHYRLSEYRLHGRSHAVIRLPIHLEKQTDIVFEDGIDTIPEKEEEYLRSMLEAFFILCRGHPDCDNPKKNQTPEMQEAIRIRNLARTLLYMQVVKYFVYHKKGRQWRERKIGADKVVPRIRDVSAFNKELFAMRMLLLNVKGPTCHDDLKKFNGIQYPTFIEAAQARNLMLGDHCFFSTFDDYIAFRNPRQLRNLLATMLMNQTITQGDLFWQKYRHEMIGDFRFFNTYDNYTDDQFYNLALLDMERMFKRNNSNTSCLFYGLPKPDEKLALPYYSPTSSTPYKPVNLNVEQQDGVDLIMSAVLGHSYLKLFILIGPGGSGKTTMYREICLRCANANKIARVYATTGIAATLLAGGQTAHRGFGLPVPIYDNSISFIRPGTERAKLLIDASVLMIDEISMLSTLSLRVIDQLLQRLMGCVEPFGGKVIVLGGDFRQLLPVVPSGSRTQIIAECVTSNKLWSKFYSIKLTQNMRAQGDSAHCDWLLKVGTGQLGAPEGLTNINIVEIPRDILLQVPVQPRAQDPDDLPWAMQIMIKEIYGTTVDQLSVSELSKRAILCATNKEVLRINNFIIDSMSNPEFTYLSYDQVISHDLNDAHNFPAEYLNLQTPSGVPPHSLKLKVGVIIMLLRNIRPADGLSNGTRLQVTRLSTNAIEAKIISEAFHGDIHYLFRMDLTSNDPSLPCTMMRRQFPIIPAYAMTINKSQGQTIEIAGIYLSSPVFAHGQLYVALSRCRSRTNIRVHIRELRGQQGNLLDDGRVFTPNVVYREVFKHGELKSIDDKETTTENLQDIFDPETLAEINALYEKDAELRKLIDLEIKAHTADPRNYNQAGETPITVEDQEELMDDDTDEPFFMTVKDNEEMFCEADFDPIDMTLPNQYLLLSNTMDIIDNEERVKIPLWNMCPYNSIGNGFIFLFKNDPIVRRYIREMAKISDYFSILIDLIEQPCSSTRNDIWGNFVRSKTRHHRQNSESGDMKGNVVELIDLTIDQHVSCTSGKRQKKYVMLSTNYQSLQFPDVLLKTLKNKDVVFGELLLIATDQISTVIDAIPKDFNHANEKFQLKFIVEFEGTLNSTNVGHYKTYAFEQNSSIWWLLDDKNLEPVIFNTTDCTSVMCSLLVYGKI